MTSNLQRPQISRAPPRCRRRAAPPRATGAPGDGGGVGGWCAAAERPRRTGVAPRPTSGPRLHPRGPAPRRGAGPGSGPGPPRPAVLTGAPRGPAAPGNNGGSPGQGERLSPADALTASAPWRSWSPSRSQPRSGGGRREALPEARPPRRPPLLVPEPQRPLRAPAAAGLSLSRTAPPPPPGSSPAFLPPSSSSSTA